MFKNQLVQIKPGSIVLDYAGFRLNEVNLKELEQIFGQPVGCVVRYIAQSSMFNKLISLEEIQWLHEHNIAILLVYEWSATRANGGSISGIIDGQFAHLKCAELGYPNDSRLALIMAIDTNTVGSNVGAHVNYSQKFNENIFPRLMGVYGDSDIIAWCVALNLTILNWLVGAKSWGHLLDNVHVEQVIEGSTSSYDMNIVHLPFWAWLPNDNETVGEIEMIQILGHSEPRMFEGNLYSDSQVKWRLHENGEKRHLLEVEYLLLKANGAVETLLTNAELDTIPDYKVPVSGGTSVPQKTHLDSVPGDLT